MNQVRQRKPMASPWALAYLAMSLQLYVYPQLDALALSAKLSAHWFTPLLAYWLGRQLGRAALTPLLIAGAVTLPVWSLSLVSDVITLFVFFPPELVAVCAAATLAAARHSEGPWEAHPDAGRQALSAGVILLLAGQLNFTANFEALQVSIGNWAPESFAAAAFILVLAGWIRPAIAFAAVAAATLAAFGLTYLTNPAAEASVDFGYSAYIDLFASWGVHWRDMAWMGLFAILTAMMMRRFWAETLEGTALARTTWIGVVAAGTAFLLPLAPVVADAVTPRETAALAQFATDESLPQEVVVTTDYRGPPGGFQADPVALAMLGFIAFAWARRSQRASPTWIAAGLQAALALSLIAVVIAGSLGDLWAAPEELASRLDLVAGMGAVAFVYAWYGRMATRRTARRKPP